MCRIHTSHINLALSSQLVDAVGPPMPFPAELFGIRRRSHPALRADAGFAACFPPTVPLPSLGRAGVRSGSESRGQRSGIRKTLNQAGSVEIHFLVYLYPIPYPRYLHTDVLIPLHLVAVEPTPLDQFQGQPARFLVAVDFSYFIHGDVVR